MAHILIRKDKRIFEEEKQARETKLAKNIYSLNFIPNKTRNKNHLDDVTYSIFIAKN